MLKDNALDINDNKLSNTNWLNEITSKHIGFFFTKG